MLFFLNVLSHFGMHTVFIDLRHLLREFMDELSVKIAIELPLIFTNERCSNRIFVVFIYFSLYMFGVKLFL